MIKDRFKRTRFFSVKKKRPLLFVVYIYLIFALLMTAVLKLPFLFNEGQSITWVDSFFTSISALTTTGLSTINIFEVYNYLGWLVIIIIFNIGGVGIIVTNTTIMLFLGRKIGINNRILAKFDSNKLDMNDIVRMTKKILLIFWAVELVGAILLFIQLIGQYDHHILDCFMNAWFLSASAASGSGFYNTTGFTQSYLLQYTIIILMIFSFIGYPIILDFIEKFKAKRQGKKYNLSLFTKISVKVNIITLIAFTLIFFILESNNSMEAFNVFQKFQYSFYMSVSTKSVGLSLFTNFTDFSTMTLFFYTVFMIIGGSPSSACGGVKVTSIYLIYKHIQALFVRNGKVFTYKVKIKDDAILRSYGLVFSFVFVAFLTTFIIYIINPTLNPLGIWFDVVSGFTTTGFSVGALDKMNELSIILIALLMLLGRIGLLNVFGAISENCENGSRVKRVEKDLAL